MRGREQQAQVPAPRVERAGGEARQGQALGPPPCGVAVVDRGADPLGRSLPDEQRRELEGDADRVAAGGLALERRRVDADGPRPVRAALGEGRALSADERSLHEPRIGADLAAIRVHQGPAAEQAVRDRGLAAFASGPDVVLGAGVAARTRGGAALLAHELAHTTQSTRDAGGRPALLGKDADAAICAQPEFEPDVDKWTTDAETTDLRAHVDARQKTGARLEELLTAIGKRKIDPQALWQRLSSALTTRLAAANDSDSWAARIAAQDAHVAGRAPTVYQLARLIAALQQLKGRAPTGSLDDDLVAKKWLDAPGLALPKTPASKGPADPFDAFQAAEHNRIITAARRVDPAALVPKLAAQIDSLRAAKTARKLSAAQEQELAAHRKPGDAPLADFSALVRLWQFLSWRTADGWVRKLEDMIPDVDAGMTGSFAEQFVQEFREALSEMFRGQTVTAARLEAMFTARQRTLLMQFFRDRMIPKGLFNEEPSPGLTLAQRVLMSGHILSHGDVVKDVRGKQVRDRPKADNCGHWAQWTWLYAGVHPAWRTPSADANHDQRIYRRYGVLDPTGRTVFGSGSQRGPGLKASDTAEKPFGRHGDAVEARAAKIEEYNEWMKQAAAGERAAAADPTATSTPLPDAPMPTSDFGEKPPARMPSLIGALGSLEVGDWLYVYNANPAAQHSVIFAGWASLPYDEGRKRDAYVYHQYSNTIAFGQIDPQTRRTINASGRGVYPLGTPKDADDRVFTVVHIAKANNVAPTTDTDELLLFRPKPEVLHKALGQIAAKRIAPARLWKLLTARARARVLGHDLGKSQRAGLLAIVDANAHADAVTPTIDKLATLVAVIQRLNFDKRTGELEKDLFEDPKWLDAAELKRPADEAADQLGEAVALPFDRFHALEHNRLLARSLEVEPQVLAAWVAEQALARSKEKKARSLTPAQQKLLGGPLGDDKLAGLSELIAVWQHLAGDRVTGWLETWRVHPKVFAAWHKRRAARPAPARAGS